MPPLPMPDDWQRALVVAAHPDDIEYGAAAAVAVWTAAGKDVHYLLATRGEAGIAGMSPAEAGPLREDEERRSAAVVRVFEVEFLDHRDGVLDHRALTRSVLDAVADAANEWIFPELTEERWSGVQYVAVHTVDPEPPQVMDVSAGVDKTVASLTEHRRYLEALSDEPVDEQARRQIDMGTLTDDGERQVGFRLYWG